MTISDLFDYKQELDELLSKIGKHVEIWFNFVVESDIDGEITNSGYSNDIHQIQDCIKDVVEDSFAQEIFDELDSTDLYISSDGDGSYTTLIESDTYEVSYVIQLTIV